MDDAMDRPSDSIDGQRIAEMFDTPPVKLDTDDIQAVVPPIDRYRITQWLLPQFDSSELDWRMQSTCFPISGPISS